LTDWWPPATAPRLCGDPPTSPSRAALFWKCSRGVGHAHRLVRRPGTRRHTRHGGNHQPPPHHVRNPRTHIPHRNPRRPHRLDHHPRRRVTLALAPHRDLQIQPQGGTAMTHIHGAATAAADGGTGPHIHVETHHADACTCNPDE